MFIAPDSLTDLYGQEDFVKKKKKSQDPETKQLHIHFSNSSGNSTVAQPILRNYEHLNYCGLRKSH